MRDLQPTPQVDFFAFDGLDLPKTLELIAPPFAPSTVYRQLAYVRAYAQDVGCKSVAVDRHYIDRDHIEDHSIFYSKSLHPHRNYCSRVHFFALDVDGVKARLKDAVSTGAQNGTDAYRAACADLSERAYLGFAVIRPLDGSPVGRTVLRCFPMVPAEPEKAKQFRRYLGCTREYSTHLLGVDLRVTGLGFQQQDVGVSACATTAIWSALQAFRNHEDLAPATPAQITTLAARFSLPFGRAMPSEGLSLDQMCQAIQALGVSPNLFRVEDDIAIARGILASAINSDFSPVLILKDEKSRHAVAVAGIKLRATPGGEKVFPSGAAQKSTAAAGLDLRDLAGDLLGMYIHDDRYGPYLFADLVAKDGKPNLCVRLREGNKEEAWALTHVLLPMHNKVRFSFANLRQVALQAARQAFDCGQRINLVAKGLIKDPHVTFGAVIMRGPKYVESLIFNADGAGATRASNVSTSIPMARYLGIVRLQSSFFDPLDLLVDTTSTLRNVHCLGIVARSSKNPLTRTVAPYLAKLCQCPAIL